MCSAISGYSEIIVEGGTSSISTDQIALMVEKVNSEAITDISRFFAKFLVERCNPIAAAEVERSMSLKHPENKDQKRTARNTAYVAADYKADGELPIFSSKGQLQFNSSLLCLLENQIRAAFSLPLAMIEKGLEIQFTDLQPQGILLQVLQETELQLPDGFFPTHYKMKLTIDQEETKEKHQLVFSFQELCQKTTIRGIKFDLNQLKNAGQETIIHQCPSSLANETTPPEIEEVFAFFIKWKF